MKRIKKSGFNRRVKRRMVQLGLTLEGAKTALDLEDGLSLLDAGAGAAAWP